MHPDIVVVGPDYSPYVYVDASTGKLATHPPVPEYGFHRFYETDQHELGHDINGQVRAIVPPEGWSDYAAIWPQCEPLVTALMSDTGDQVAAAEASAPGA